MNRNQPKNWPNQNHNFSHIAYYLDNFNSQDCTPQTVKQISRLLHFSCNQCQSAEDSGTPLAFITLTIIWPIKNQWLEISPFPRYCRTYCHFLIVQKTLASALFFCHVGKPTLGSTGLGGPVSFLVPFAVNCVLAQGFQIRHRRLPGMPPMEKPLSNSVALLHRIVSKPQKPLSTLRLK